MKHIGCWKIFFEYNEWCCNCPINHHVWEGNYNIKEPYFDTHTQGQNGECWEYFQEFNMEEDPPQSTQSSSLEVLMMEYMAKNDALIQSQASSLRNLENQMRLLANDLCNRPYGDGDVLNDRENAMGEVQGEDVYLGSGKEIKLRMECTSIHNDEENEEKIALSNIISTQD